MSKPTPAEPKMQAVLTGNPLTQLLACTRCGVLVWDVLLHWSLAPGHDDA